ncbi:MAG: hypothetical protein ACI8S6_004846 [Myxococcota bacterium]|jgi:hypothetical protein
MELLLELSPLLLGIGMLVLDVTLMLLAATVTPMVGPGYLLRWRTRVMIEDVERLLAQAPVGEATG